MKDAVCSLPYLKHLSEQKKRWSSGKVECGELILN